MDRTDRTMFIALCASICLHVLLLQVGLEAFSRSRVPVQPAERSQARLQSMAEGPPIISQRFGDSEGTGDSTMSSPGIDLQEARSASQNQAAASRDPAGVAAIGQAPPSPSVLPTGPSAMAQTPVAATDASGEAPVKFGYTSSEPTTPTPHPRTPHQPTADAQASAAASPASSADAAPMSDSEVDPFSIKGAIKFRPGKTEVQFGRKYRITRPQLPLSGQYDLISLRNPRLIMKLKMNDAGDVIDAQVVRSSGSDDVDTPFRRAAFDWWFEPPTDKSGHPMADVQLFWVEFR